MAWVNSVLDENQKACNYYDQTLVAYRSNINQNPNQTPYAPSDGIEATVNQRKSDINCK